MEDNSADLQATRQLLEHGRRELGKIIAGQTAFIDQALVVALCRGHALIEGVPRDAEVFGELVRRPRRGRAEFEIECLPGPLVETISKRLQLVTSNKLRDKVQAFRIGTLHSSYVYIGEPLPDTSSILVDDRNRPSPDRERR